MPVNPDQFAKDHFSLLAYLENVSVDFKGVPDLDRLRINQRRHPGFAGASGNFARPTWNKEWSTRTKAKIIIGHDDLDCAEDLKAAGWIEILGTGINPVYRLTDSGQSVAARLRQHKARGGTYSTFDYLQPAVKSANRLAPMLYGRKAK